MEFSLQCGVEIGKREGGAKDEGWKEEEEKYSEVCNSNKFVYA
jgi:hypothetical protein